MNKVNSNEMRNINAGEKLPYPYTIRCFRCRKLVLGIGRNILGAYIDACVKYKNHLKRNCR